MKQYAEKTYYKMVPLNESLNIHKFIDELRNNGDICAIDIIHVEQLKDVFLDYDTFEYRRMYIIEVRIWEKNRIG